MVPRVFVYGEDGLTLKYIRDRLGEILVELRDKAHPEDCTVFYRPSFGRAGFYGEFDAIIITPEMAYLVESKWEGSRDLSKGLKEHQILRHKILRWYHDNWKGEGGEEWDVFANLNNPFFKTKFAYFVKKEGKRIKMYKYIPYSTDNSGEPTTLTQNLQTILKELRGRELEDVLLIFYKDKPFNVKQEGFTTINIKYEQTLGLYTQLK